MSRFYGLRFKYGITYCVLAPSQSKTLVVYTVIARARPTQLAPRSTSTMTILVTGATGTVGGHVVEQLVKRGATVRALVRDPSKGNFPPGVEVVQGDLLDVDALRSAFAGVSTLFLLNGVVADEFTQALLALNLAREAGI